MKTQKMEKIKDIRKKFHKEWLLIAVDSIDKASTVPLTGHVISHSHNRDEIYKKSISYKGLALIDYSEDQLPKDVAVVFKSYA